MNEAQIYTLSDGVTDLLDHEHSRIMFALVDLHPEASRDYTWDDIGMATLMQTIYQDEIRFCPQNKSWYIWEKRWKIQNDDGVISDKLQTLLNILKIYADEITTDENEETIGKYKNGYLPFANILLCVGFSKYSKPWCVCHCMKWTITRISSILRTVLMICVQIPLSQTFVL